MTVGSRLISLKKIQLNADVYVGRDNHTGTEAYPIVECVSFIGSTLYSRLWAVLQANYFSLTNNRCLILY